MDDRVQAALDYIASCHVMTLATSGPTGTWASAVFYVADQFTFYFLSAPHTRHVSNLEHNPRCAATIQRDYDEWQDIRGIQMEGVVLQLGGEARDEAAALYAHKYTFLEEAPTPIKRAMDKVAWFSLTPDRLYYLDNSRGFAHRDRIL